MTSRDSLFIDRSNRFATVATKISQRDDVVAQISRNLPDAVIRFPFKSNKFFGSRGLIGRLLCLMIPMNKNLTIIESTKMLKCLNLYNLNVRNILCKE